MKKRLKSRQLDKFSGSEPGANVDTNARTKSSIYYLSLLPGTGKTRYAQTRILDNFRTKKKIIIYVSPTVALLDQLLKELKTHKNPPPYCIGDFRHQNLPKLQTLTHKHTLEPVSYVIERALRNKTGGASTIELGDALLITHEAFMRTLDFVRPQDIEVIFDEAGSMTQHINSITLDNVKDRDLFFDLVTEETRQALMKNRFVALKLKPEARREFLQSSSPLTRSEKLIQLLDHAADPRFDVYLMASKKYNISYYDVVSPAKIFDGFQRVLIMSAFFESTQMYHILKKNYNMVDISAKLLAKNEEMREREDAISKRYQCVTLHALTDSNSFLSKNILASNLMVTQSQFNHLECFYQKHRDLPMLARYSNSRKLLVHIITTSGTANKLGFGLPVEKAMSVVRDFDELVCKVSSKSNLSRYLRLARRVLMIHGADIGGRKTLCVVNTSPLFKSKGYPPEYPRKVVDPEYTLMSPKAHGSNEFTEHANLIFLCALNPDLTTKRFYADYMPDYEYENDLIANTIVQCVTRTSIRNPNSSEPVHILLPDKLTVNLIHAKLRGLPKRKLFKLEKPLVMFGSMAYQDETGKARAKLKRGPKPKTLTSEEKLEKSIRYKEYQANYYKHMKASSTPEALKVRSLRAMLSAVRKKLKTGGLSPEQKKKAKAREATLLSKIEAQKGE